MKILFISLGCDKNLVDTEMMLGMLTGKGYSITDDENEADAVVINTCCFINDAKQESINTLLEMSELRKNNEVKALIACGCLAQRYKEEIQKEIPEVDVKLLKLAQIMNGKVVTNDYNLNKVAMIQGVPVLNINELANAIKPVVLPGEKMVVTVVKDGKEHNQGVAYLDDGTMIVVENGRRYMGETIEVEVTSVIQTNAGRMIFGRPVEE